MFRHRLGVPPCEMSMNHDAPAYHRAQAVVGLERRLRRVRPLPRDRAVAAPRADPQRGAVPPHRRRRAPPRCLRRVAGECAARTPARTGRCTAVLLPNLGLVGRRRRRPAPDILHLCRRAQQLDVAREERRRRQPLRRVLEPRVPLLQMRGRQGVSCWNGLRVAAAVTEPGGSSRPLYATWTQMFSTRRTSGGSGRPRRVVHRLQVETPASRWLWRGCGGREVGGRAARDHRVPWASSLRRTSGWRNSALGRAAPPRKHGARLAAPARPASRQPARAPPAACGPTSLWRRCLSAARFVACALGAHRALTAARAPRPPRAGMATFPKKPEREPIELLVDKLCAAAARYPLRAPGAPRAVPCG